jgi:hypothetical protein
MPADGPSSILPMKRISSLYPFGRSDSALNGSRPAAGPTILPGVPNSPARLRRPAKNEGVGRIIAPTLTLPRRRLCRNSVHGSIPRFAGPTTNGSGKLKINNLSVRPESRPAWDRRARGGLRHSLPRGRVLRREGEGTGLDTRACGVPFIFFSGPLLKVSCST